LLTDIRDLEAQQRTVGFEAFERRSAERISAIRDRQGNSSQGNSKVTVNSTFNITGVVSNETISAIDRALTAGVKEGRSELGREFVTAGGEPRFGRT
jgi:hypothetical protein